MEKKITIRQAIFADIPRIEAIYQARVRYNDAHDIHQWNLEDVTWNELSKLYQITDLYVCEVEGILVGCCCIVDEDALYWPEIEKGVSLYLHKICIDPLYGGLGYADALIDFFIKQGTIRNLCDVRLDVRAHKQKLRAMYERHGFTCLLEKHILPSFQTALYVYVLKKAD